ncbi:MAG: phosphatidylglycerol lysyltransferase domain-containing protein [Pseudomonadota bacterium]
MTASPMVPRRKLAMQFGAICIVLPLCALVLQPMFDALSWRAISQALTGIGGARWVAAVLATVMSFAAIGCYDVVVQRHLHTRQTTRDALLGGAAAIGLAQFLGFGLITGTIARWRALPSLSSKQAATVAGLVFISFLVAWLGLFGASGLLLTHPLALPDYVFWACLSSCALFVAFTALRRHVTFGLRRLRLPSLLALRAMLGLAALDTCFAALALWFLLPGALDISYASLLPVYLAGLGLALMSNTPGGVGPFEAVMIWSYQGHDINALLAGLLAFRVLYVAAPAVAGALYLSLPRQHRARLAPVLPTVVRCGPHGLHPEASVARQTGALLCDQNNGPVAPIYRTTQCTVSLFDPVCGFAPLRRALVPAAASRMTWPLAYKIGARNAMAARRQDWAVMRVAADAIIRTQGLTDAGKPRSTLRRKRRKAEAAGVKATPLNLSLTDHDAIWDDLQRVDANWQRTNGPARGLSMGRFDRSYLATQRLFTATRGGQIVGFASFHTGADRWVLDLMRQDSDAPDGTMHAIVWNALLTAQQEGCAEVSLVSVPSLPPAVPKLLARSIALRSRGLAQFKRSFAPAWRPLYAAAPGRLVLFLTLWDVWKEVQYPDPLACEPRKEVQDTSEQSS